MYEVVEKLAKDLRLSGICQAMVRRCEEATKGGLHPAEFLRLVLEDERLSRRNANAKRLTKRARFRSQCDIENWDMSTARGLSKARLKELAQGHFYERKENLIVAGPTGVGKTHLAIALGRLLCSTEVSVVFYSTNILFEQLTAEKTQGKYLQALQRLSKIKVLILDDFGLRNYSHDEATYLLEILEERYNKGSVIITSQVDPNGWKTLFQDSVISEAIIDRMINPSQLVTLEGESYRKKVKSN